MNVSQDWPIGTRVRVKGSKQTAAIAGYILMDLGGVILSRKIRQFTHWNVRDLVRVGPPTTKSRKAVSDSSARIRARLMASGLYPELK